jgi:hypothetical protein
MNDLLARHTKAESYMLGRLHSFCTTCTTCTACTSHLSGSDLTATQRAAHLAANPSMKLVQVVQVVQTSGEAASDGHGYCHQNYREIGAAGGARWCAAGG